MEKALRDCKGIDEYDDDDDEDDDDDDDDDVRPAFPEPPLYMPRSQ